MSDIVGYRFKTEVYCGDCVAPVLCEDPRFDGWQLAPGVVMSTEENLDDIAWAAAIDRADEASFDVLDFPKVVRSAEVEDDLVLCERCGAPLEQV